MVTNRTDSWVVTNASGRAVNDLINHLGRVASALDEDVSKLAMETGCTELPEVLAAYDLRQNMVRMMVVLEHQLNSILPDDLCEICTGQPTNYS